MQTQQQMQSIEEMEGRSRELPRRYLVIMTSTIVLFTVGTVSGVISVLGFIHGSFFSILSVVLTSLAVAGILILRLFPSSSSSREPAVISSPPSSGPLRAGQVPISQSLSPEKLPTIIKNVHRDIRGLPPPTLPKIIHQRRRVVEEIYALLTRQDVSAIVLTGIGGVGKSTLAALVSRYIEEQYRMGIGVFAAVPIWISIDPTVTLADLAGTIFEILDLSMPDFDQLAPSDQALTLFNALNAEKMARIVVLDQFESLLDLHTGHILPGRPGIGEWLDALNSQPCTCRVLITSRLSPQGNREYPPTCIQEYSVDGLSGSEGAELLRKQGVETIQATEEELYEAVNHCSGHALALTLLASLLRRNRNLTLRAFLSDPAYTLLWTGDVVRNLLDYSFTQQLDLVQRKLLLAFSIYREAISLDATQMLMVNVSKVQILAALDVLLAQHLLNTTGEGRYQLHPVIASYVQNHFDEINEETNQSAIREMHTKPALYYIQQAKISCPPRGLRRRSSDVHFLIEAIWHLCQAGQFKEAYTLIEQEDIFPDLKRWGGNAILLELYELLLPLTRWDPTTSQEIVIYRDLGRIYRRLGQRERALEYLFKAFEECKNEGVSLIKGSVLSYIGSVYGDLGQYEQALHYLYEALSIRRAIGDHEGEGWTLNNLGRIYRDLGDEEQGQRYLEQAWEIRKEVGDRQGEARTLITLGRIYDNLGQKERAQNCYEQVLRISKEIGDRLGEGLALKALGLFYADLGQKKEAQEFLEQALKIRREVSDRGGEGRTLNHLGRVYRLQEQDEMAQASLEQALQIGKGVRDRLGEGKMLNNLALVHYDLGHYEQAMSYLEQALNSCREVGDRCTEGWTLHNLGRLYAALGKNGEALEYYEQALRVRREVSDRRGEGWTLHNIGIIALEQKRYDLALACLLSAKSSFKKTHSPDDELPQRSIEQLALEVGEQQYSLLQAQVETEAAQIIEQALTEGLTAKVLLQ